MRVLIGCECSGIVRQAFRDAGHDAWSCDLKPAEDGSKFHFQQDIMAVIGAANWDFIGLHPECTAMAVSGNRWYGRGMPRHAERIRALDWTQRLWNLAVMSADHVYLENPVSVFFGGRYMKENSDSIQYLHPWQFGHGETKKTGISLFNLPPLTPTNIVEGREQRVWKMPPGPNRKADRSRTYRGIAAAMAEQWGATLAEGGK